MIDFESSIAATLRADAGDAARDTDSSAQAHALEARLDLAVRRRTVRRWAVGAGTAAAVAAGVALAVVLLGRPATDVAPAVPTPTPTPSTWTGGAEILGGPELEVPGWAAGQQPLVAPRRFVRWEQSGCTTDCVTGSDEKLVLLAPYTVLGADGVSSEPVTPIAWAEHLDLVRSNSAATMTDWTQARTRNAGVANVTVITTTADVPAAMGCEQLADTAGGCRGLVRGTRNVVAVVDAGQAPLVIWLSALASIDAQAQDAEMTRILASLRLTGVPVSCRGLLGPTVQKSSCVPDLDARTQRDATLLADGGAVTAQNYVDAVRPLIEAMATGNVPAYAYEVVSPSPLPDDLASSTAPFVTRWTFDGTPTVSYVCFVQGTIIVTGTDCR